MYLQEPPRGDGASSSVNFLNGQERRHDMQNYINIKKKSISKKGNWKCKMLSPLHV